MKKVTISEVREISKKGVNLILQGCGGDLEEWVNGINDLLKEAEILKEGERLDETYTFNYEGLTNLIFANIENKVNIGKLAMWRLKTRELFGSMWLDDYVANHIDTDVDDDDNDNDDDDNDY